MSIIAPNKLPWIIVAVMVAINLGLLGYISWGEEEAQGPPQSQKQRQKRLVSFFQENIGLDQEQTDTFTTLWEEFHSKAQKGNHENRLLRAQLHQAISSANRDQAVVDSLLALSGAKVIAHERAVMEHFDKLFEACSPEQQEKLSQVFAKMMAQGGRPGPGRPEPRK